MGNNTLEESLESWSFGSLFIHKITEKFFSFKEFQKLQYNDDDYVHINVDYKWDEIIPDIINKCYVKNPKYYNLGYHEHIILNGNSTTDITEYIFNAIENKCYNVNSIDNDGKFIIPRYVNYGIIHSIGLIQQITDFSVVEKILGASFTDKIKLTEYKKFCNGLFKTKPSEINVFHDYDKNSLLKMFLVGILNNLERNEICYKIDSYSYYDDKKEIKKFIEEKNVRCVFIYKHQKYTLSQMIKDFEKLGIKNMFICVKDSAKPSYFNIQKFDTFLRENKELICPDDTYIKDYEKIVHHRDIFFGQDSLMAHFLKWCCE